MKKEKIAALTLALMVSAVTVGSAEASFKDDVLNFPTATSSETEDATTTTTTTDESVNLFDTGDYDDESVNLFDTGDYDSDEVNMFDSSETTDTDEVNMFDSSETSETSSTGGGGSSSGGSSSGSSSGGSGSKVYQCNDGIDNDGDGLIDYPKDPGCSVSYDNTENTDATAGTTSGSVTSVYGGVSTTEMACSDGIDNDGDGLIDFPLDPDCLYKMDPSEGEMAVVEEHTSAPRQATKSGATQSGPAENALIAGLASLLAVYFVRRKNLAKEN